MEQKLIDLTSISKKALQVGENLCSKADNLVKECKIDVENIEQLYPKLKFLWNELVVQLKTIDKFRHVAMKQNGIFGQFYSNKEQELTMIVEELEQTLKNLRGRQVDPAIRENAILIENAFMRDNNNDRGGGSILDVIGENNNNNSLEQKKRIAVTLYEYIEEQGLHELKIKTQDEVATIQQFFNSSKSILDEINSQLNQLREMYENNTISLEESGVEFSYEKSNIQERETHSMAETLFSITRHYDQVASALKTCQPPANVEPFLDISVLEKDTSELPTILNDLQEGLQMIESTSEEVRIRHQIYQSSYDEALKLFCELEKFTTKMENLSDIIKELETEFEKSSQVVDRYLEELWNLNSWYKEFSLAYDNLVVEIDRRHRVKEQNERLVEEFLAKLDRLYAEEQQKRDIFIQNHGRYLPADLCPPIQEKPIRYEITSQDTKLPTISNKALSEARENLLKHEGKVS